MIYDYPNNQIDSSSIISPLAIIGKGNYIGPNCYIGPNVVIGDNNRIEGFSSIGTPPESKGFFEVFGNVKIGDNNVIREFTTINSSVEDCTIVGNNCLLLKGSHVGHDAVLEDGVILSCNALVGGFCYLMRQCNLALGSIIHQRVVVGSFSMIGMGSVVTKKSNVKPGGIYVGVPCKKIKQNDLSRFSVDVSTIKQEECRYREIRKTWKK